MHINNPKKKAIAWFAVLIVLAIIITMINRIIQVLAFQGVYVHPEMPQFLRLGVFILSVLSFIFSLCCGHIIMQKKQK